MFSLIHMQVAACSIFSTQYDLKWLRSRVCSEYVSREKSRHKATDVTSAKNGISRAGMNLFSFLDNESKQEK